MRAHKNPRRQSPPPCARFAVVLHPGTLFETVDVYAITLKEALAWAADTREPGVEVDVMRVTSNGSLTTEF